MTECKFTKDEVNLILRALRDLDKTANNVKSEGFEIGDIRERIAAIIMKIGSLQEDKNA